MENKSSVNFHGFGLGDAGGPIESSVDDLCNRVGFIDVAAQRFCWRHFEEKNSLDSQFCTWFRVNRTINKRAMSKQEARSSVGLPRSGTERVILKYLGIQNYYFKGENALASF
jgi:hypothetical protein